MNKLQLQSEIKTTNGAYLYWFLLGAHYAYLGRWGTQILFWLTLGGFGFWLIFDMFTMKSKIDKHNAPIYAKIEELTKKEKDEDLARNIAVVKAANATK